MISKSKIAVHHATMALVVALAAFTPQKAWAQRMRITVGGPGFRPMPVAVPDLEGPATQTSQTSAAQQTLLDLLRLDIDMMRHFDVVPPKTYLTKGSTKERTAWPAWQNIGARALVRGEVEPQGEAFKITLHLDDVVQQKRDVVQKTCRSDAAHLHLCSHQFVDAMVEWLSGEKGIFSSRIAFVRRVGRDKQIFSVDADGQALEKTVASGHLSLLPAWDPSGQYLLFTSFVGGGAELFRLARPTGNIMPLSRQKGLNIGAQVSPDGKRIVLTLSRDGNTEIYTMAWDGSDLKRLTQSFGQDVSATWSPDSKRLAFVSSRAGSPQIYVMDADGQHVRRLTFRGTYNQEPDWSPRPEGAIAFTARDEQLRYDIFLAHPETGAITRLTQEAGDNQSPSHSPDGQHVVFTSTRAKPKVTSLFVMDVDGKDPRMILADQPDVETPAWGPRQGS